MIRPFEIDDIEETAALLAADASENPWDANGLLTYYMRDDTLMLVWEEEGVPVGFAAVLLLRPEAEILDLTVRAHRRRRGCGEALLRRLLAEAYGQGVRTVYLEVRSGNEPAKALYRKLGFEAFGVRKNYYTEPAEDAIVMKAVLTEPADLL